MGDWSALPGELLCLVSDRLGWMDYVRFAAVCVSWQKAVAGRRDHPPLRPQPPWLMSVPCSGAEPTAADFFCLADRRSYRLDLPEPSIRHRMLIGSADGWLVTADEVSEMHVLNPITGVQIRLPSILTLPTIDAIRDANGRLTHYYVQLCDCTTCGSPLCACTTCGSPPRVMGLQQARHLYVKVVLSHSSSSDWTAVLLFFPGDRLFFARVGDRAWTFLPIPARYAIADVMFHQGQVYVLEGAQFAGITTAWDLTGPSPQATRIGPPLTSRCHDATIRRYSVEYLVESGGDVLQVWRKWRHKTEDGEDDTLWTSGFDVFKLDERKQKWFQVKSLGEQALFVGLNSSMSLSALEYPELKGNYIYFTDDEASKFLTNENKEEHDIGVFSFKDESIDRSCPYDNYRNWPPPVWIMPRLF